MPDGMVIAISHTLEGSAHDITITRELIGDLGAFGNDVLGVSAKDVSGADPPKNTRRMALRVLGDAGFKGLGRDLPGAEVVTPAKRPQVGISSESRGSTTGGCSGRGSAWRTPSRPSSTTATSHPYTRGRSRTLTQSSTSRAGWPTRGLCSGTARTATGSPSWAAGRGASGQLAAARRRRQQPHAKNIAGKPAPPRPFPRPQLPQPGAFSGQFRRFSGNSPAATSSPLPLRAPARNQFRKTPRITSAHVHYACLCKFFLQIRIMLVRTPLE